jgi:hypothetical protein
MHCVHCGTALQEGAAFCHSCGTKQPQLAAAANQMEHCHIKLVQVDEKWSLFGKDIFEFQVFHENGQKIMSSAKITLSGFEYNGPKETNTKHKRAMDELLVKLLKKGWHMNQEKPLIWYDLSFWR